MLTHYISTPSLSLSSLSLSVLKRRIPALQGHFLFRYYYKAIIVLQYLYWAVFESVWGRKGEWENERTRESVCVCVCAIFAILIRFAHALTPFLLFHCIRFSFSLSHLFCLPQTLSLTFSPTLSRSLLPLSLSLIPPPFLYHPGPNCLHTTTDGWHKDDKPWLLYIGGAAKCISLTLLLTLAVFLSLSPSLSFALSSSSFPYTSPSFSRSHFFAPSAPSLPISISRSLSLFLSLLREIGVDFGAKKLVLTFLRIMRT